MLSYTERKLAIPLLIWYKPIMDNDVSVPGYYSSGVIVYYFMKNCNYW